MNVDDSNELARLLRGLGLVETNDIDEADVVHINTCSVRRKAEDKFFSFLGTQRIRKQSKPALVIGAGGCTAELRDLRAGHAELDYVIGARDPNEYFQNVERILASKFPELPIGDTAAARRSASVFQTVMRGCSNYCSYCVVPYARGHEESLPPEEIARRARIKAGEGAREITLLGQNILAYGEDLRPKKSLLDVFGAVHDLEGLIRLRFVTSHPRWVKEEFLRALSDFPKVCEQFHVPFQSGDDEILKRMNRGYTSSEYRDKIGMIRECVPGAAVSADSIVGFPGETEEQFENTMRLVEEVRPDQLYAFKYSAREGTRAAGWEDGVPREIKEQRLGRLLDLHEKISREINESLIGKTQEVMVNEEVEAGRYRGRTRTNKITDFRTGWKLKAGDVVTVRITGATPHALRGEHE